MTVRQSDHIHITLISSTLPALNGPWQCKSLQSRGTAHHKIHYLVWSALITKQLARRQTTGTQTQLDTTHILPGSQWMHGQRASPDRTTLITVYSHSLTVTLQPSHSSLGAPSLSLPPQTTRVCGLMKSKSILLNPTTLFQPQNTLGFCHCSFSWATFWNWKRKWWK